MYKYRIGVIKSDMGGCYHYRIFQPLNELRNLGVDYTAIPFLPCNAYEPPEDTLVKWVEQFDLIIIQRCYRADVFEKVRWACNVTGRKLVFETDDDYINLPPYNPCAKEFHAPGVLEGLKDVILSGADHVTVTTQELKDVYYPYNKNITVLPNNVQDVSLFKDEIVQEIGMDGKVPNQQIFGFLSHPSFVKYNHPEKGPVVEKLFRLGYTGTPTHREDYLQIKPHLEKFLKKYPNTIMMYFGDEWFPVEGHPVDHKNVIYMPNNQIDAYLGNIRCFDVGIAPLVPDIFNMGKSSLKLLEYASWGIPAVAPNYVTYNRHFTHMENALLYNNGREFTEQLEYLYNNHQEIGRLGYNAARMVNETRTERVNSQIRFDLYESLILSSRRDPRFLPNKRQDAQPV